jgi:membrane protease YdiL (CAAX protease family)
MSYPLPDSDSFQQPPREFRWTKWDLGVFAIFFGLTVLFLPLPMLQILQLFQPELAAANLTGVQLVIIQAVMDLILVGFIFLLVKVVHGRNFLGAIQWTRVYPYQNRYLIALGASLAVSVLIVSALFPPAEPPPIERLITSSGALYMFVLLGVGVAPLVEEIIFRGFLYRVLEDVGNPSVAVFGTAALFTSLHIPQLWGSWAGIVLIFVVGYALSLIRRRSNSLIPSFIIHTSYNAMLFTVYAIGTFAQESLKQ